MLATVSSLETAESSLTTTESSLETAETLLAEPGVHAERTQRNILQPLVDRDLVHPHRFRAVRGEDLLGFGFALG